MGIGLARAKRVARGPVRVRIKHARVGGPVSKRAGCVAGSDPAREHAEVSVGAVQPGGSQRAA
jgi:hypothetical protein